jgi:UDP-N-acetylglucosamine acyltransferase
MPIHPTAVIDPHAEIDPSADIGPYVVVDGPVVIGARTRVCAHAMLTGRTTIGTDNVIHMGAILGHVPQDVGWTDAECGLRIGDRNVFREHSTVHRATKPASATVIGNDNYLMVNAHVAHDCQVGDHVIIADGALMAGHVQVDDRAFISGNCVVHQHVRIGRLAFLRGLSRTSRDVPPFCIMDGTHTVRGLNRVGLRRAGLTGEQIRALQRAFVQLFRTRRNLRFAVAEIEAQSPTREVAELLQFIRASRRGVACGPRQAGGDSSADSD